MRFLVLVCALLAAEAAKLEGYVSQQPGSPFDSIPHIPSDDSSVFIGSIPTDPLPEQSIADETHSFVRSGPLISGQVASGQGQFLSDQPPFNPGSSFSAQTVSKSGPVFSDQSISGPGQVASDKTVSHSGSIFLDQPTSGSAPLLSEQSASGVGPIFYDQTNTGSRQEIHGHDISSSVFQPFDPSSAQLLSATSPGLSVSGNPFVNDQSSLTFSNSQFSQASSQTYGPPALSQTFDSSAQRLPTASSGLSGSGHSFVNDQSSLTFSNTQGSLGQGSGLYSGSGDLGDSCLEGQILHVDGRCVTPEVSRHVFVYAAPKQESKVVAPPKNIPLPKVEHNIVFIRAPDSPDAQDPIIIPPPQKKNIIYVLNKESEIQGPKVIEVPAPKSKNPEVYFVNYEDGENPILPGGIDFETALNSAVHSESQVIGGGSDIALSGATAGSGDRVIGTGGADFSGALGSGVIGTTGPDFSGTFGDGVTGTTGPAFIGTFGGGVTGTTGPDFSGAFGGSVTGTSGSDVSGTFGGGVTGTTGPAFIGTFGSGLTVTTGSDFSGAFGDGVTGTIGPDFSGTFGAGVTGNTEPDFSGTFGDGVTGTTGPDLSGAFGGSVTGTSGSDVIGAFGDGVTGTSGPDVIGAFGDGVTGTTGPDFSGAFGSGVTGASEVDFSGATGTTSSGFSAVSEPDFGGETSSLSEVPSTPVLNPEESLLSNDQFSGTFGNEITGPSFGSSPAPPPALIARVPQQLYAAP
ncbi:nuclear pore complex protein Nup153-like [Macrobrachium nipponense]|uniref:nuclear pore complex protein Nup153-like n=1 Tax=Macrobrachium nipponense TaxID=159736 RepID=UPI0030C81FB3